jgi:predicted ester cyclase
MNATNPNAVVEAFVEEYKNHHNWDCVDTYIAEDCKLHLPLPGLPPGREGMRENGRMMCTAFPDVRVVREFAVIEGDIVVERAKAKATHKAELMGIPASNNPVTWTELHAYRVAGNQITEIWTEADFLGVMVQIGAVKMPEP